MPTRKPPFRVNQAFKSAGGHRRGTASCQKVGLVGLKGKIREEGVSEARADIHKLGWRVQGQQAAAALQLASPPENWETVRIEAWQLNMHQHVGNHQIMNMNRKDGDRRRTLTGQPDDKMKTKAWSKMFNTMMMMTSTVTHWFYSRLRTMSKKLNNSEVGWITGSL